MRHCFHDNQKDDRADEGNDRLDDDIGRGVGATAHGVEDQSADYCARETGKRVAEESQSPAIDDLGCHQPGDQPDHDPCDDVVTGHGSKCKNHGVTPFEIRYAHRYPAVTGPNRKPLLFPSLRGFQMKMPLKA